MRIRIVKKIIAFIFLVFLSIFFVSPAPIGALAENTEKATDSTFWIEYIDVGKGDSALIQCDGHYMLIDGGTADASSTVYSVLKGKNITYLDCIIATHPDSDHIGGLPGALNYAKTKVCYSSVLEYDSKRFQSLLKYLNKQNAKITIPEDGLTFSLGSATIELSCPFDSDDDVNNNSIITRITYGENVFLFMGDAEKNEEKRYIDTDRDLHCDVIKIGHHGSSDATGNKLLNATTPVYAVISVGNDNSYNHPSEETVSKLKENNIILYRTDLQGNVIAKSDGVNIIFETDRTATESELYRGAIVDYSAKKTGKNNDTDTGNVTDTGNGTVMTYVLNTNTHKFHYPDCSSVSDMKAKNRKNVEATREELIADGYTPCGNCNP